MANQTVYPYGQGGTLPSGYPIADDLETDSAQHALSAKQGVVLKGLITDAIPDVLTPVSFDIAAKISASITVNGVWSSVNATKHSNVEIQVKPGQKFRILANATNPSIYAFFANYSSPTQDEAPDYAPGEDNRHAIDAGQTEDITIPNGCYFLYICLKNASVIYEPQSVLLVETAFQKETDDVDEVVAELSELRGNFDEKVVYADLSVTAVGDKFTITKTGSDEIYIRNASKSVNNYALIVLPDTLEDGKEYNVSFAYKSFFTGADSWFLGVIGDDYSTSYGGVHLIKTGYDFIRASFKFTFYTGYKYLRLSGYAVTGGYVLMRGLSISDDKTSVAELTERVKNIEDGVDDFVGNPYYGEKIQLNPNQKYKLETVASNAVAGQSAALYDKYLFIVKDKFASVTLYNMETKAQVYTWNTGQSVNTWHCNQTSFGAAKYDENDMFPVVYVSMRPDSGSNRSIVHVYRIIPTLTNDVVSSFTMTLVQTINLPAMTEQNGLGLPNATIDTEKGWMWTYSRNTMDGQSTSGLATFTKFAIPALFDGGGNAITTVTLEDSDIKDSFMDKWQIYDNQGAFIRNGKMYMMRGVPGTDNICECNVIDLYFKRTRVSRVDLYENGARSEPEGCFYYNDTICYTVNGAGIYRIVFN